MIPPREDVVKAFKVFIVKFVALVSFIVEFVAFVSFYIKDGV
jgi:hypothetical protein